MIGIYYQYIFMENNSKIYGKEVKDKKQKVQKRKSKSNPPPINDTNDSRVNCQKIIHILEDIERSSK